MTIGELMGFQLHKEGLKIMVRPARYAELGDVAINVSNTCAS